MKTVPYPLDCFIPQRSELGLLGFIGYTDDVIHSCSPVPSCIAHVTEWRTWRRLKTSLRSYSSRHQAGHMKSLTVGSGTMINMNPINVLRDLGILLDSELTTKKHTVTVAARL